MMNQIAHAALVSDAGYEAPLYSSRADVPEAARWRLEDIYVSVGDWEADAKKAAALTEELAACKGHVMDSAASLWKAIDLDDRLSFVMGKLYSYAVMRSHEDTAAEAPKALASRATQLSVKAGEAGAFITPEILAADEAKIGEFIAAEPKLELFRLMFDRILRRKKHVLSSGEEAVMAAMGELAGAPDEAFSMLTDADMDFGTITDESGTKVPLTQEGYGRYISSPVRAVRQAAFEGIHRTFAKFRNTLGATYSASVKKDCTFARLRRYGSALEASLESNEIPVSVYGGLIDAVNVALPALHEYVALKKKALGVEHMEPYDLYAPFAAEMKRVFSYETAQKLVLEAVAPLGDEYVSLMKKAFAEQWIDVYENRGKRSGAYSWGCWGVHPYMLLNYGGTYRDVSTLAHEGGHSIHTWLSNESQPQVYASYALFVAEVASTVNELLLVEYLLKNTDSREEKVFLLNQQLELIRQTIYRQTLFAEFERDTHAMAERGEPLTPEGMNRMWSELNARYYGAEVGANVDLAAEWSRIPHFYSAFYVYQYATSLSAAVAIVDRILSGGEAEREAYLTLLRGGCSADPITLLKGAGVDMSGPEPVERALAVFARKTKELAALL
ncbi:MAG: oligoendopeptidase F [Pyramidobacter sp.]|nr:oligoendopeptidase F [Pyramidobacter sp.]